MPIGRRPRPLVLCVLDGWGHREDPEDNAIALAATPVYDRLWRHCPHALLNASAGDVGLPSGQMGNSEVGHTNLGAGRVVMQDMPRIDTAIANGSLAANQTLERFTASLGHSGGKCHIIGLVSPGGVHAHQNHIVALARILDAAGIPVLLHAVLDGRDTPPQSALDFIADVVSAWPDAARIATVSGRYFAMDRDHRWERVARAHGAMVAANGVHADSAMDAIRKAYAIGQTDEFVAPTVIADYAGMADGDGILMANFRADRAREILTALFDPAFDGFERPRPPAFAAAVGMVSYSAALDHFLEPLFSPLALADTLGEVVAGAGLQQLRIAETEKYAHVTFFFNGGRETEFPGEARTLVPSPKVATYDLMPEMSAHELTDKLVEAIDSGRYDFVLVNYANADMVGHTGQLGAAVSAVQAVDAGLGRLLDSVERAGGVLVITADHGNAECMRDRATGHPMTAHTTCRVPLIVANAEPTLALVDGRLADVAPTLLAILGLAAPGDMTGRSLIAVPGTQQRHAVAS